MRINFKWKYLGIILVIISGYFFLYFNSNQFETQTMCPFKLLTGMPCPACGSTRATIQILHGNFRSSILLNPFGLITNLLILISIFWMIFDVIKNKETYMPFLKKDWNKKIKLMV